MNEREVADAIDEISTRVYTVSKEIESINLEISKLARWAYTNARAYTRKPGIDPIATKKKRARR